MSADVDLAREFIEDALGMMLERSLSVESAVARIVLDARDTLADWDAGIEPERDELQQFMRHVAATADTLKDLYTWAHLADVRRKWADEQREQARAEGST